MARAGRTRAESKHLEQNHQPHTQRIHKLKEQSAVSNLSTEERVIKIVCNQMGTTPDKVARDTSFVNDLGADSLDTVELVMEFEDEFEISIPDEDAEKIQTVGNAVDYIASKI